MTEENQNLLKKIYECYANQAKPLLADIEALYERFPLPLYNEIRSLNDHVARAYIQEDNDKVGEQIEKAQRHMNRIVRDCYKFLNLYYKREAEEFDKKIIYIQPREQTEYELMAEYGRLSDVAIQSVEYAKKNESTASDEATYANYEKSYNAYTALHDFIVLNRHNVFMMAHRERRGKINSVILSIITFIIGCIVTNNNQAIIEAFKAFIPGSLK